MPTLFGRNALVTGGSRGIGAEIVRRLAADGAAVAFTDAASAEGAEKLVAHVAEAGGRASRGDRGRRAGAVRPHGSPSTSAGCSGRSTARCGTSAPGARIINIGSVGADRVPVAGQALYATTKGAVSSFTRGLARELGSRGINVNDIQPGPINTDMNPDEGDSQTSSKPMSPLAVTATPATSPLWSASSQARNPGISPVPT